MPTAPLQALFDKLSPEVMTEATAEFEQLALEYRLHLLREELELSQRALASEMGISQPSLSAIENRGIDNRLSTIKRYVEALGGKLSLNVELPNGKHIGMTV